MNCNNMSTTTHCDKTTLYRIAVVSNITLDPWFSQHLSRLFESDNIQVLVTHVDFSLCTSTHYAGFDSIAILLSLEDLFPDNLVPISALLSEGVRQIQLLYDYIKSSSTAPIIWIGFEDYSDPIRYICGSGVPRENLAGRLNEKLRCLLSSSDIYLDFSRIIAQIGTKSAYDLKNKFRWNAPYSSDLIAKLSEEICRVWKVQNCCHFKCLVLDCDNVLWGGCLAEDGVDGISIGNIGPGRAFFHFQKFVLELYNRGIILALCTKNDIESVYEILQKHSGMLLHKEHFACIQANWNNKPDNLRAIANLLNIGLDSLVFVDDSPYEIGMVRESIPEVKAILFQLNSIYESLSCFAVPMVVDSQQIKIRNQALQTNVQRETLRITSINNEEYLRVLNTQVDIHLATEFELSRIAELSMRTNRCTNGVRFNLYSLKEALNLGMKLYAIVASDRFSNLGLVGAVGIIGETLKLFSLSCRALGRNIEKNMLDIAKSYNVKQVEVVNTGRNDHLRSFLQQNLVLLEPD